MRSFPKQLATFRRIVDERGEKLRLLSWEELVAVGNEPTEHIQVESRPATISIIVQPTDHDDALRVVVQGFMKNKLIGSSVALDGFYKHRNGDISPMPDHEFHAYD